MNKRIFAMLLFFCGLTAMAQKYDVVPMPLEYSDGVGLYRYAGTAPKCKQVKNASMPAEAYKLEVTEKGVTITAADARGWFYGRQTLDQLVRQSKQGELGCCTISDAPRFGYRGVMLDVVRCYIDVEEIKKIVDVAAQLKLNTVHLHLTDDNGWRLEIKKYPKLTEVGAWRVDREELFPGRLNARSADEPATYGGVYTQKEMRDLVKYAAARHITILPEIEMPAHSAAAIASYPELCCPVVDKFVGVFPGIGGKDASIIMCAGNDKVLQFYRDVIDEVLSIFPSEYIHLGGDEAVKTVWEKCPLCNERISKDGLHDHEELQGWFMDQIISYVQSKGRKAIGWDEVTMGHPKEDITIMGWRGDGGAAVRDSRATGHQFILTPAKTLYLIRYQGPQWFEPFTYFGNNTLADVYGFEPVGKDWDDALKSRLWGVQGSLWSEFCRTPADMQYLIFPRLLGVADMAWRAEGKKDWAGFCKALDKFLPVLDEKGITHARSMFNIDHKLVPTADGDVQVTLSCIRPDVEIRYAVDAKGTQAVPELGNAKVYREPLKLKGSQTVYACTYRNGEKMGETLVLPIVFNKATGHAVNTKTCTNQLDYALTNGLRGSDRNSDFEWAGWHNDVVSFMLDLGAETDINEISLGNLVHSDICVAAPRSVYFYVSSDNNSYTLVKTINHDDATVWYKRAKILNLTASGLKQRGRYIKVVAVNPGCIPDGMAREGAATWMYFDEISVK